MHSVTSRALVLLAALTAFSAHAQNFEYKRFVKDLRVTSAAGNSGSGSPSPLTVDKPSLAFSSHVGVTSPVQTVLLTNAGSTGITVSGTATTAAPYTFTGSSCLGPLPPGQFCTFSVSFTPTSAGAAAPGTLTISTSAGNKVVELSGTGTLPQYLASVSPSSLAFTATLGATSGSQVVMLTNTGADSITHSLTPTVTGPFLLTSHGCTGILAPGGFCPYNIAFRPTVEGTSAAGSFTVTTSAGDKTVSLTGNGTLTSGATVLRLSMDGVAGTAISASADALGGVLSRIGTGITYSSIGQFGQSAYFPGGATGPTAGCSYAVGQALEMARNANYEIGGGDFTVEAWIRPASVSGYKSIVYNYESCSGTRGWGLGLNGSKIVYNQPSTTGDKVTSFASTISANVWTHVALVKTGTSVKLYVNGVQDATVGTYTSYTATISASTNLRIGNAHTTDLPFVGLLDDIRIIKGGAAYGSNFTPPTVPH